MPKLRVAMLGPLDVTINGQPATPTAPRLRAVLAVLALSAGRPVPLDHLASAVWGDAPPIDTRRTVTVYLTRLRRLLGSRSIRSDAAGHTLAMDPDDVDALRFAALVRTAGTAAPQTERSLLGAALRLWRGPSLVDVPSQWLAEVEAARLTELRLDALERRITLDLDAGAATGLDAELRDLTARYPFREHFWAYLMTVLHRSGRRADALAVYQRLYRLLDDELGVEPGPAAQAAHLEVLGGTGNCRGSGPGHHDRRLHPGPDGRAVRLECLAQVVQQRALSRR